MKSTLAFTVIGLQILTLAAVVYFELETRRSTKTSLDRLEQVRDNLAGSVTRQSEIVLRLKGMIDDLDRQSDHAAAQAYLGGEHKGDAATPTGTGSAAGAGNTGTAHLTADAHLRQLIQAFRDLQNARLAGNETDSMNKLFKDTENDFVARG